MSKDGSQTCCAKDREGQRDFGACSKKANACAASMEELAASEVAQNGSDTKSGERGVVITVLLYPRMTAIKRLQASH